ncbi:histidine triad nucleotide-binding protein [Polyangium jinanense]|uniref:Histidine triad nucleotide-binding protein n=1 Tax=Polyangium jinanense TaxID=2829994 RepID=A0A9X3X178_9BACT|nr:histidine triad nucleotide-binding protein [Polyangium jinanense]MDC3952824.1 histidine triad nucleotide-binding protein [Polyangium jinanense]MDC3980443.1 histidine triad nucleotide-binding protein [Polyangium jinanense]
MCIFCKIAKKEIPAKLVLEDDDLVAFHDINAQAPIHVLVIPKQHITGIGEVTDEHVTVLGKLLVAARRIAEDAGLSQSGFRVVVNHGQHAGQTVHHLHVHVLGGRPLAWPPG